MPRHREDVFAESLEVTLLRDVAQHDHAALEWSLCGTQHGSAHAQDAALTCAKLDLRGVDVRARAQGLDHGDERGRYLARRDWPLLDTLTFKWLAHDEARGV